MSFERETIFALATAAGRAGVSVMRVSGPKTCAITAKLISSDALSARRASLRILRDPKTGEDIDKALVLFFEGPASFTGEDMVEFQTHGSPAVIEALAGALYHLGLREAERGEFTRRAFENGRMDLTEAEGLADLIDAQTQAQRAQAYRQMEGGLKRVYEDWREALLDALAQIEGEIDFPDEEDVPDALAHRAGPLLEVLAEKLQKAVEDCDKGERVRHGVDVAIIGRPNSGKSTIINRLSKKDAAIVSDEAGTTRDIVEVAVVLGGLPVRLSDTAGLRDTDSAVEAEGVRRARARGAAADIRIGVIDMSAPDAADAIEEISELLEGGDIIVLNKADLYPSLPLSDLNVSRETFAVLELSAKSEDGTDILQENLGTIIEARFTVKEDAGLTRARHRACVERALAAVRAGHRALSIAPELAGEDLRAGLHAIKELAGESDIEAVLDRIFTRFCVGK